MGPACLAGVHGRRPGRLRTMRAGDTHPGGLAGLGSLGPGVPTRGEHEGLGHQGPGKAGASSQEGMGVWVHGGWGHAAKGMLLGLGTV